MTYKKDKLVTLLEVKMKKSFKKLMSSVVAAALLLGTLLAPANRADAAGETLLNTYGASYLYQTVQNILRKGFYHAG